MSKKIKVLKAQVAKLQYGETSARAAWLEFIVGQDGKELKAVCEAALANPPSVPTKGKNAGKCEPPMGWIRFFQREGAIKLI